jgi:hypothetical protein
MLLKRGNGNGTETVSHVKINKYFALTYVDALFESLEDNIDLMR